MDVVLALVIFALFFGGFIFWPLWVLLLLGFVAIVAALASEGARHGDGG